METFVTWVLHIALIVHLALAGVCVWRVWRGENNLDRLLSADVIGTIGLAVLILIGLLERNSLYIDAALGLAALSAIGTIALAKLLEHRKNL